MKTVAILGANKNSIYKQLQNVEVYDECRDLRNYDGPWPVVAHPPCRGYSAFMRHWAKPKPGEKGLALFCIQRIKDYGGVLEHPAHSRLFTEVLGIRPGQPDGTFQCVEINQSWFGYPTKKRTWLLMPKNYVLPQMPFILEASGGITESSSDRRIFENMSQSQRSRTTKSLAKYLLKIVRLNNG